MSEPTWELLGGGGVLGPAGIDYVGAWVAGTTYQPGQVVRYNGVDYLAVNSSVGQIPPQASAFPQAEVCIYDNTLLADTADPWDIQAGLTGYAHLRAVLFARSGAPATTDYASLRFNNDANNNYDYQRLVSATTVASAAQAQAQSSMIIGYLPGGTSPANLYESIDLLIPNPGSTIAEKVVNAIDSHKESTASGGINTQQIAGFWRSVAAINRIRIYPATGPFKAGSRLTIYGMLAQGQAPPSSIIAPGGFGLAFPASPGNGDLFTLVDSLTAPTYAWDFRYVASIVDAFKWVFVGGSPVEVEVSGSENIASATYINAPTVGPSFTIPRAGTYLLGFGMGANVDINAQVGRYMSPKLGAAAAVDADAVYANIANSAVNEFVQLHLMRTLKKTLAASDAVIMQYRGLTAVSSAIFNRWLTITPVRVS